MPGRRSAPAVRAARPLLARPLVARGLVVGALLAGVVAGVAFVPAAGGVSQVPPGAGPAGTASGATPSPETSPSPVTSPAPSAGAGRPGPVVLVGVDGAGWSAAERLPAGALPQLRRLADRGAVGSLSVRTGEVPTCPVDGWLTVSAGRRAVGPERDATGRCPDVPAVAIDPTSVPVVPDAASGLPDPRSAGRVEGWAQLRARNEDSPFAARIGSLSEAVSGARSCVTAVGPGAALAAAGTTGDVDSYVADPRLLTRDVLTGCAVTVVDAGPFAATADAVLARVAALLPPAGTLLVAGIDDGPTGPAGTGGLRVAVAAGPGFAGTGPDGDAALLATDSTRWPGLVQLTDLAPTLLAAAGIAERPATFVGARLTSTAGDRDPAATLAGLGTDAVRARTAQDAIPRFYAAFGVAVAALLLAAVALGHRAPRTAGVRTRPRVGPVLRAAGRVLRAAGLVVAAAPVATRLASLVPWHAARSPGTALAVAVAGAALAVAAAAVLVARAAGPPCSLWRRAAVLVAGATVAVVALDLVLGSPLQRLTVIGLTPIQGGRFYGMGNEVFAATGMSTLFCVAALAARRPDRAVAVCAGAGAAFVALDGLPGLGADFGGVPASVAGFGVAALALSPVRPRARRVVAVAAAAAAVLLGAVLLDLTRAPQRRTHVGAFAADLLSGSGSDVVARKAAAATAPFLFRIDSVAASVAAWLALGVLLAVAGVIARPRLVAGSAFAGLLAGWPELRACLLGAVAFGAVGFALNDSGVAVPVLVLEVGAGLVVASLPSSGHRRFADAGPAVGAPPDPEPRRGLTPATAPTRGASAGSRPAPGDPGDTWESL